MPPVFLIGFMGAGKTTLGRALEAQLPGWRYIDLDEYIERKKGMTIQRIFASFGEAEFRRMEREALAETADLPQAIIGCGGGTPCFFDNMEFMGKKGVTVLLQASRPVLLRRLIEAQGQRPKLNGLTPEEIDSFITTTLAEREPYYSKAQHSFPSDLLETPSEIEASCREFIRLFISPMSQSKTISS